MIHSDPSHNQALSSDASPARIHWAGLRARFRFLIALGLLPLVLAACGPGVLLTPPPTPEPLVPTAPPRTSLFAATPPATLPPPATQTPTALPPSATPTTTVITAVTPATVTRPATLAASATPAPTTAATALPSAAPPATDLRTRVGVGVPYRYLDDYTWGAALPGWFLDWKVHTTPMTAGRAEFAQMVRMKQGQLIPDNAQISLAARSFPGSLWLVGNEPDVAWQDDTTAEQYATAYHTAYEAIKAADPGARVAIGGVSQVTPLRLRYLQRILDSYRAQFGADLPLDVWNIHTFVLREEKDSWGVGLPPGFEDAGDGSLWTIEDHNRLDLVQQEIVTFRRWMAEHGQRNKPLIISEYGILMPADYGFPPDVVARFLTETFTYFATANDPQLGYPADANRLVQRWCWYSTSDDLYATGNLFDYKTGQSTAVWRAYSAFLR